MEAWYFLSALGGAGALRLWRTEIRVLPACFVDAGRIAERDISVDTRLLHLHMDRAGGGGHVDVRAGAAVVRSPRHHLRRRALCGQSLSPGDRLLAQRVCRIAGELPGAAAVAVCVESGG